MTETSTDEPVSLEDLRAIMREAIALLNTSIGRLTKDAPGSKLQNLQSVLYSINAPVVHRPPPLEGHLQAWTEFLAGNRKTLDDATVKYLCWTPEIAVDGRFIAYLEGSGIQLNWHILGGLICSCHFQWELLSSDSPSLPVVRELLKRYKGNNRVLRKWQDNPEALLGKDGPAMLAEALIRAGKGLPVFLSEWRLETQTPFFQKIVEISVTRCREQLNRLPSDVLVLLFRDLLPWPGWKPTTFKREIGALILHRPMPGQVQETLQRFIIQCRELGDPRLPVNRIKWVQVPQRAREIFIQWLLRKNPLVTNEHVYQQGRGWTWKEVSSGAAPLSLEPEVRP